MVPYFSFSPLSTIFTFFPNEDIFSRYPATVQYLNFIAFYEIFDGFFRVPLKFNIIVQKPLAIK
jgi:transglutaminase/protease-like cytokinesis protein 3